jgi:hypothetical protein
MNHYDGPIRNTEQQLDHIYYTLFFSAGAQCCCIIYQLQQSAQLCEAKTIFLSQTGILWMKISIQFYFAG